MTLPHAEHRRGLVGTVEANVPQYNTQKANVGPEAKKSEIQRKLTFSPVNTSSDRSALDKLRGVVRGQGRDEQRKRWATHVPSVNWPRLFHAVVSL